MGILLQFFEYKMSYYADAPDHQEILSSLAIANQFSMKELEENRTGKITDAQRMKLMIRSVTPVAGALLTCTGWSLFLYVLHVFHIDSIVMLSGMGVRMMLLKAAIIGFVGSVSLGCLMLLVGGMMKSSERIIGLMSDLSTGRVAVMQGKVWASRGEDTAEGLSRLFGRKTQSFHYVLGEHYFEVSGVSAYEALLPREFYRVYFVPKSKLLLSIEPATGQAWKSQSTPA
jgi:hypothetical protein